jgi:hypothetical protein
MNELEGRALDEAVAKAMGSTSPLLWRRWSDDVTCVLEMTAWFDRRSFELIIGSNPKATDWTKWSAEAIPDPPGQCFAAYGETIQQALARLVVAVAEKKENAKP